MTTTLYPLTFHPIYKDYLWGGTRILQKYHRDTPVDPCAESWELTDRPEGQSIVAQGPLAGRSLHELIQQFGPHLLGTAVSSPAFPLLIKLIDAREPLSIQVHPNEESARRAGGEPKTEAWYLLDPEPGAAVYAGFRQPVTPEHFQQHIRDGHLADLLQRTEVKSGDVIDVPGGRVHAIDRGCLLLEVQQNSNTTYRVFDWNRVGKDGTRRELHLEQAVRHINWNDDTPSLVPPEPSLPESDTCTTTLLLKNNLFSIRKHDLTGPCPLPADPSRFRVLFIEKGTMALQHQNTLILQPGQLCLLPAALEPCTIAPLTQNGTCLSITP